MNRMARLAVAVAALGHAAFADAQVTTMDLAALEGRWRSTDPALGGPAVSTMAWTRTLGGAFLRLDYRIGRPDGVPVFEGTALYPGSGDTPITAFWADSNGDLLPISAVIEGPALTATWGTAETRLGRTRYQLEAPDRLLVTDWLQRGGEDWQQFSRLLFRREAPPVAAAVTGIGGFFFRGRDPQALADFYQRSLGIDRVPQSYDESPWQQQAGPTVFAPFADDTDYFGDRDQQWMINLRVRDLNVLVASLREQGIDVEVDATTYPNGRFARLVDPEGNPIQLWEPAVVLTTDPR